MESAGISEIHRHQELRKNSYDEDFWLVLWNTIKYALFGVPISLLVAFLIAYWLNEIEFCHDWIRAMYFIPFLTTAVALAWVWRWFYQPMPIGYFNIMLSDWYSPTTIP